MALLHPIPNPRIASLSTTFPAPPSYQLPLNSFASPIPANMAGLKRKRSENTLSPDSSFDTPTSRSHSSSPSPFPHPWAPLSSHSPKSNNYTSSPSDLHSRTRKRVHSRPPDESAIHGTFTLSQLPFFFLPFPKKSSKVNTDYITTENTYNLLFSAARSPHPSPARNPTQRPSPPQPITQPRPRQSSLHTFWTLPSLSPPPPSSFPPPLQPSFPDHATCQDCDAPLLSDTEAADVSMGGMDLDADREEFRCRGCGRAVCKGCAVVAVGEGRECLQCRTSAKRWIGGIGWMT